MGTLLPDGPLVVVITGSRKHSLNSPLLRTWATAIKNARSNVVAVVHGDCPTGADRFFDREMRKAQIPTFAVPAEWDIYARRAGMLRNQKMVGLAQGLAKAHEAEVIVIGFPIDESPGTRHCMEVARRRNLYVLQIESQGTERHAEDNEDNEE